MRGIFDTIAWRAARQHGRVSYEQLIGDGIDAKRIERWLRDGRLRRVHHGVYAVGHTAPSHLADYMAAVLACGAGAVLSHAPAAYVLKLLRGSPPPPEVTVPTTAGRRRPGIVVHRVRSLHVLDHARQDGIPITIVPRILLDMAPRLQPADLRRACHEAWIHHRTTPRQVEACIARNPAKKGAAKLRAALGADVTLSVLEVEFVRLLREHGLPAPRTNIVAHGDRVDCHWPQLGVTVELLSYRFHGSRAAFEADVARRRRSGHLAFTYGDVFERSAQSIAELRPTLSAR